MKLKKEVFLYTGIISMNTGLILIGLGLGCSFNEPGIGVIIGIGIALTSTSIILFKLFRRFNAYNL
ncbi:hypothetical protein [Nonlabens sp. Asnod2-A12]|uniref:hypothetical protein n=1 Tax=Nonlabens sp. Asnod2-A12 TaxID=3160578 RepID=UPI0038653E78